MIGALPYQDDSFPPGFFDGDAPSYEEGAAALSAAFKSAEDLYEVLDKGYGFVFDPADEMQKLASDLAALVERARAVVANNQGYIEGDDV